MTSHLVAFLSAVIVGALAVSSHALGQDNPQGKEPIDESIQPSELRYDILVDATLERDDAQNNRYKSLQAAYEAAPEGTAAKPTVIGIAPNVYQLPGGETGASLNVSKNYITLLGLTNNRRAVVLADNRGHAQGATDNGYVLNVNATGFTAKNLTILNYCNVDYEYPGDASKNLAKRSDVITQAVVLQAAGDKHVYENVALLSRLDTMFLRTTRSYFKNVYIEGTDDFIGGGQVSYWEDCTIVFPTGRGVMSASQIAFVNCRFQATQGFQFYKSEFGTAARPVALIRCTLPANSPQAPVAWSRGKLPPRPSLYSLTYHVIDETGKPAVIYDSSLDPTSFNYTRELSEREAGAFNPWNLLRAAPNGALDDWDPAGAKEKYEALGQGSAIFRMALTGSGATIRTGGEGATLRASVLPARVADQSITWSTDSNLIELSRTTGELVVVMGKNLTDKPEDVAVRATAANGFYATAYVRVEPKYLDPPQFSARPKLGDPVNGAVTVEYSLDLRGKQDQSLITWSICDDAQGGNPREVAVSRGNVPLRTYTITPGDVGKHLKVEVQPKHQISDPGPPVIAVTTKSIAASDVPSLDVSPNFRNFVTTENPAYVSGQWTILGTWSVVAGDNFVNGFGVRAGSQGASLLYQQDVECGDMQVDLVMSPEKTAGMGFGSPGSPADGDRIQKSDVYIKYDPRTKTGYALRYWRTTQSAEKCMFQLYKIDRGVGTPLNENQVLSGVFKPDTSMTLKVIGNTFTVSARNDADRETLALEGTIEPNPFGGAGFYWAGSVPRGNSNVYSRIQISYPGRGTR